MNLFLPNFNFIQVDINKPNQDLYVYCDAGRMFQIGMDPYAITPLAKNMYVYPPTFLPLYSLCMRIDYDLARYAFFLINLIIFGLTLAYLAKSFQGYLRILTIYLGLTFFFVSAPLIDNFGLGQIDLIVGSIAFGALLLYLNHHSNLSALFLATAVLLKINPVFLLATFAIFFHDWKFLIRFGIAFALIVLVSFIFVNPEIYFNFLTNIVPHLSTTPQTHFLNQTPLRWMASHEIPFFEGAKKGLFMQIYTIGGALALMVLAWVGEKHLKNFTSNIRAGSIDFNDRFIAYAFFTLNIGATFLLSARVWSHAYVWFILPLIPLLLLSFRRVPAWLFGLFLVGAFCVLGQPQNMPNILDALNLVGAAILIICVLFILAFPGIALPNRTAAKMNETLS